MKKLRREFYRRDTCVVARELLGKYIIYKKNKRNARVAKIVEVEAYLGNHDLASHSSKGLTKRNAVMFGPPGHAYVYLIYGIYHCLNIVVGKHQGSAILIRAVEPIKNIKMRTNGPGLLCDAMNIDLNLNGHDLLSDTFYLAKGRETEKFSIVRRQRIGVAYAKHWAKRLLRFYIKGNAYISKA